MSYRARIYVTDTRPERPLKGGKPDPKAERPKGGWRSKGGARRLPQDLTGSTVAGLMAKVAEMIQSKPEAAQRAIESVSIERYGHASAESFDW